MSIKPLGDRVLLKPLEEEEQRVANIIIPDTAKEKPQRGEIIETGPGETLDDGSRVELEVKKGDKVLYSKYAGTEVKIDDEDYLILREADILAIIA